MNVANRTVRAFTKTMLASAAFCVIPSNVRALSVRLSSVTLWSTAMAANPSTSSLQYPIGWSRSSPLSSAESRSTTWEWSCHVTSRH